MQTILTRRGRFAYRTFGDPRMPVLVLLMGLGMNSAAWPEVFLQRLVRKGLYIIAPDNRDSGASMICEGDVSKTQVFANIAKYVAGGTVRAPYKLEDMAADVGEILSYVGVERAHIAGISMGGMIAQAFACRAPHRAVTLTCISSATGNARTGLGSLSAVHSALAQMPPEGSVAEQREYYRSMMKVIGTKGEEHDDDEIDKILAVEHEYPVPPQAKMRQLLAILASGDRRKQLAQLTVPALVIHGTDDPLLPTRAGREIAESIEGAVFMPIQGMGHDLPKSRQEEIADAIAAHCYSGVLR